MASLEEIGEKVYYSVMIPLAFAFSASYHHFQWRVAPAAVERWAEENGFVLIKQDGAPGWGPWYSEVFNFLRFYRVLLEDESGQFHEACLKVGRRLQYVVSVSRCPVVVRWEQSFSASQDLLEPSSCGRLWDREVDRGGAG